ncbi:MAG: type II toxin-antitoxin system VapC family toxin [Tunicatimonas sp.]|uniref:type II toxin-antitoxin system VapC family toxin n=1 Tax=Tunicatimonas sp. TaxID=1940096 RepID=UPI003C7762C0
MRYLLDTQAVIFSLEDNPRLPKIVSETIEDIKNLVFTTVVSLWKIAIKRSIGKLSLEANIGEILQQIAIRKVEILLIITAHLTTLENLPYQAKHRDPLDSHIISQLSVKL